MASENQRTVASLAGLDGSWDVLNGVDTSADLPVCANYASILTALDALSAAGFASSAMGVLATGLNRDHDLTTCLRFRSSCGDGVVLVRRHGA